MLVAILLATSLPDPNLAPSGRGFTARTALAGPPQRTFLPLVSKPYVCQALGGQTYETTPTDRVKYPSTVDAERDPDINLALRGYVSTSAELAMKGYNGASDPSAPQLVGLFPSPRYPAFSANYLVRDWNWSTGQPGAPLSRPEAEVTMTGIAFTPGEALRVPDAPGEGQNIGDKQLFEVLVLYASESRVTLKYTRDDNVVEGYTLHVENVCVEPSLVTLYRQMDAQGRGRLPGLVAGQPFGRAKSSEVDVAIRDWGSFMDPRSQKDWWVIYLIGSG